MENSRTPLRKWFMAFFLFSTAEQSISAMSLSRILEVTYKTAWLMLHKLRDALDQADHKPLLEGVVRIQGGAYGSPFNPYTEKDPQRHPLLAGGSIQESDEVTNLILTIVEPQQVQPSGHISYYAEQAFIQQNVSSAATDVQSVRYRQHRSRFRPLVRCISDFSKWVNATFHGLGRKYLQAYANEYTFRYNSLRHHQSILPRVLQLCCSTPQAPTRRSLSSKYHLFVL